MIHIYLLKRKFGSSLVLHPFSQKKSVVRDLENMPLTFHYSQEPEEDERVHLLYGVYSLIDASVDLWVQELKYIPRLLASAAVFLLVYLFTALVIRIPVPLVDEILFSSAAAVAVYLFVAKKNTRSDIAMKRRVELKHTADQADEQVTGELKDIEHTLSVLEELPPLALSDMISGRKKFPVKTIESSVSRDAARCLEYALVQQKYGRKLFKGLSALRDDRRRERFSAYLYRLAQHGKVDLPLFALYVLLQLK